MFFTRICDGCGMVGSGVCVVCIERIMASRQPHVGEVLAGFEYVGIVRELIIGLKYRNHRSNARVLADALVNRLEPLPSVDILTWLPTTRGRIRQRGVDHAELLARSLSRRTGIPARRLLYKTSYEAQTGRTRRQRLDGPTFVARPMRHGQKVMVVDDVVTTGASFDRARAALIAAGARGVTCVAIAATPVPGNTG